MADSYEVSFTVNVGHGIDVSLNTDTDGSLTIGVRALSPVSLADAENMVQTAFATLQTAWAKARS